MTQNMYLKSTLLSMLIFSMLLLVGLELVYADYWEGNIFILEADRTVIKKGNFSMSGAAKKFYRSNPDEYEMLIFFPNFSVGSGSFGTPVRNDTRGIGLELMDKGEEYGSQKRLEHVVLITHFLDFPDDPYQHWGKHSLLSIIAHEVGHRWLAFPNVDHPPLDSEELLGRNKTHWSFFLNTVNSPMTFTPNPSRSSLSPWIASSCMEGNYWVDNQDGSFTASQEYLDGYSLLDQYLMGLVSDLDVGGLFVIHDPYDTDKTRESAPAPGTVVKGTRVDITVNDIIAAEGPRIPDLSHSQRRYKQAFVLVVERRSTPTPEEVAKLNDARVEWESYYVPTVTEDRLTVDTSNHMVKPNPVPIAEFTYTAEGLTVTFDASSSFDPEGGNLSYYWDFGDGTTAEGSEPIVSHDYPAEGQYMVSMVVSDGTYFSAPDTQPVNVGVGSECIVEITDIKYNDRKDILEVRATTTRSPQEAHMVLIVQNGAFTANMEYNSKRKFWFYKGSVGFSPPYLIVVEDRLNEQPDPPPASGEPYCGRDEEYYDVPAAPGKPIVTSLMQAYPTPANPEAWIPFTLSKREHVVISIYDVRGGLIRRLDLGERDRGVYLSRDKAAYWDGRNQKGERVSNGIYFYVMEAGTFRTARKMVILK